MGGPSSRFTARTPRPPAPPHGRRVSYAVRYHWQQHLQWLCQHRPLPLQFKRQVSCVFKHCLLTWPGLFHLRLCRFLVFGALHFLHISGKNSPQSNMRGTPSALTAAEYLLSRLHDTQSPRLCVATAQGRPQRFSLTGCP
jgi:hypothetical protein